MTKIMPSLAYRISALPPRFSAAFESIDCSNHGRAESPYRARLCGPGFRWRSRERDTFGKPNVTLRFLVEDRTLRRPPNRNSLIKSPHVHYVIYIDATSLPRLSISSIADMTFIEFYALASGYLKVICRSQSPIVKRADQTVSAPRGAG
jgi:hypothetical protein